MSIWKICAVFGSVLLVIAIIVLRTISNDPDTPEIDSLHQRTGRKQSKAPTPRHEVHNPSPNDLIVVNPEIVSFATDFLELDKEKQLKVIQNSISSEVKTEEELQKIQYLVRNHATPILSRELLAVSLLKTDPTPDGLGDFLLQLADDAQDPKWFDYCLQYMAEAYPTVSNPKDLENRLKKVWNSGHQSRTTAALLLVRLSREYDIHFNLSASAAVEMLNNKDVPITEKITLVGILSEIADPSYLYAVRETVSSDNVDLKRTAIAALGKMGAQDDVKVLTVASMSDNRFVMIAAESALLRIEKRLKGSK